MPYYHPNKHTSKYINMHTKHQNFPFPFYKPFSGEKRRDYLQENIPETEITRGLEIEFCFGGSGNDIKFKVML